MQQAPEMGVFGDLMPRVFFFPILSFLCYGNCLPGELWRCFMFPRECISAMQQPGQVVIFQTACTLSLLTFSQSLKILSLKNRLVDIGFKIIPRK
jgi:hypothetical protein